MIFVLSWKLLDFSQGVTQISKASDANNPNMFVTDNLGNRYNSISVSGDANGSIIMEKGKTYYGSFIFRPPKPSANRFAFHDEDNDKVISDIVLDKPSIYIYEINLKWSPATITYYSDKWTSSQTDQGGFKLTHTKYPNCEIAEAEPGEPKGSLINTIEIGSLTYEIYRTQQTDFSLREYVLVGGVDESVLATKPRIIATIPYDNSAQCLDAVGTVLASFHTPSP
jgi:hypothetical protein